MLTRVVGSESSQVTGVRPVVSMVMCASQSVSFCSGELVDMRSTDCDVGVNSIKSSTAVLRHVCVASVTMFELNF